MLTQADFKKLGNLFITKVELKKAVKSLKGQIDGLQGQIIDVRLDIKSIREEMATKDDFRKVVTILDKVLKEVLDMRQEQTMHVQSHRDIEDEIKNIKKKLNQTITS